MSANEMSVIFKPDFLIRENENMQPSAALNEFRENRINGGLNKKFIPDSAHDDLCTIEADDKLCGSVFFNEVSRELRFACCFCENAYDVINDFCTHLSEHFPDEDEAMPVQNEGYDATQQEEPLFQEHRPNDGNFKQELSDAEYDGNEVEEDNSTDDYNDDVDDEEMLKMYEEVKPNVPPSSDVERNAWMENQVIPSDLKTVSESNTTRFTYKYEKTKLSMQPRGSIPNPLVETEDTQSATNPKIKLKDTTADTAIFPATSDVNPCIFNGFQIIKAIKLEPAPGQKFSLIVNPSLVSKTTQATIKAETDVSTMVDIKEEPLLEQENSTNVPKLSFVSDYEEFLKKEQIRKVKNRKVTTVKVITLKNRIDEIYEAIQKLHERERLGIEAGVTIKNDENETENRDPTTSNAAEATHIVQKLYDDTLITHTPSAPDEAATSAAAELKKNICPACGKKFRNAFSLTVHKRAHYLESDSRVKLAHKCSDCPQLFNKLSELKDHLANEHYPDGYVCRVCNKRLCSLSQLETHMIKVHLERQFFCKACKCNFGSRREFEWHNAKAHLPGDNYKCHICGRKYSKVEYLSMHMERHKQQKPNICGVCGKETMRLGQHMKIHAPHPQRLHSCIICNKTFKFSSGLSIHFKKKHNRRLRDVKTAMLLNNISTDRTNEGVEQSQQMLQDQFVEPKIESRQSSLSAPVEDIIKEEEEAQRVIVELVQNVTYKSFFPPGTNVDHELLRASSKNMFSEGENNLTDGVLVPPIAREEVISAVNSIVDDI